MADPRARKINELTAALRTLSAGVQAFTAAFRRADATDRDRIRTHPDVLEADVAAASWYPEVDRG